MNKFQKFFSIFMISIFISAFPLLSLTEAVDTRVTYAFIGATPNPVGVNQETLLHIGITQQYMSLHDGWKGLTVQVTDPSGKVSILGPFNTDPTGGTGYIFVPSMIGNYTFQTFFPQQVNDAAYSGLPAGTIMLASNSTKLTLEVTQEPTAVYPTQPLPTEYWSRPIDDQLHGWSVLAGNWQRTPDNLITQGNLDAPETPHILWAKPLVLGGIAGAETGDHIWTTGDAYQGQFASSVIMNGILYYNVYPASDGKQGYPIQGIKAVDLRTGDDIWYRNGTRLSFGQLIHVDTMNMQGVFGYIWNTEGTTWSAYDAWTGEFVYKMYNVPSGTTIIGPNNEILIYTINSNGWMTCWNSTTVINVGQRNPSTGALVWEFGRYWNPFGTTTYMNSTYNAANGYDWNVTVPKGLSGAAYAARDDKIVGQSISTVRINTWAIDLNPNSRGRLLYNETWTAPTDWAQGNQTISRIAGSIGNDIIAIWSKETQQIWGFSTDTGRNIWGPTERQHYLDMYGIRSLVYEGKLYAQGMSGILYVYDVESGELLWTYSAADYFNQNLWANQWNIRPLFVADGKLYMGTAEHSPNSPQQRGAPFVIIDVNNGTEILRADGLFKQTEWGGRAIIGDSIIATLDTYDQRIYAVGKGPTALKVNAPDVSVEYGKTVVIRGTIKDISAGTDDYSIAARFPDGVPAVSDESQTAWMLYVYKDFQRPINATGVLIELSVIDSNGNYRSIGTTTSDADGFFRFNWKPDIEGDYTLYASFAGSKAYWPSHAVTSFVVDPALATPTPVPTVAPSMADLYFMPMSIAVIIAIIVVGMVIVLLMRKKP